MSLKNISILGSTGSIGIQTLDVIRQSTEININYLTTNGNIKLLQEQIEEFNPKGVVINDENQFSIFKSLSNYKGKILCGKEGLIEAACNSENNLLVSALVGFAGLEPTLNAIDSSIDIALANKETLVVAGEIFQSKLKSNKVNLFPIDSEHSAIQQCIKGENTNQIEKILLTASGGPFRNKSFDELKEVTIEEALSHPNWEMGKKITIDSATMMNKGFELIEAYWLFNIDIENIEVVIHPQSIIHSMVQFKDASIKAQLGVPDMKVPIAYALNQEEHLEYKFERLDFSKLLTLDFYKPELNKYKNLDLAIDAISQGGNKPCILNAANEITVEAFLNRKISFLDISNLNEIMMGKIDFINKPSLFEIFETDKITRQQTKEYIENGHF